MKNNSRRKFIGKSILAFTGAGVLSGAISGCDSTSPSHNDHVWFFEDFGAVGDYFLQDGSVNPNPTDDTDSILAALASIPENSIIYANPNACYWFGDIPSRTTRIKITKNVHIDWRGANLKCHSGKNEVSKSTALFEFYDCSGSFRNYIFEDISYSPENTARGVIPVFIRNEHRNTENYDIGPFHVIAGQSLLTCYSQSPHTARASNITLIGNCTAEDVYYGVNLGYSGDRLKGSYTVNRAKRLVFLYGVDAVNIDAQADICLPSSGSIMLSSGDKPGPAMRALTNINIKASIKEINAPVKIYSGFNADGKFNNISLNIAIDSLGENIAPSAPLIVIDGQNSDGKVIDMSVEKLKINISCQEPIANPIKQLIRSDNMGIIIIADTPYFNAEQSLPDFIIQNSRNNFTKGFYGDTVSGRIKFPLSKIYLQDTNKIVRAYLHIACSEDSRFFGQNSIIAKYALHGFITSNKILNIQSLKLLNMSTTGPKKPKIDISTDGQDGLQCQVSEYSSSDSGSLSATLELL
jgi:hypothetical protein